ncbi:LuxR family transcriptional regulator [Conexibacter sp. DBS9H8]|uniref:helix-turn-helix transcriptional regulator n=1 Tax=Conexibacter sp. DBS9H8 TaxID=2937801 RepID=UPI00201046B8|nr:LuxR family transcriptional regulator [Conexibacter sp. DBS9H8]
MSSTLPPHGREVPAPPRGRERELATLLEAVERAQNGVGSLVVVEGEGGIGKSRLSAWALEQARRRGLHTRAAAADEFERHRPFSVIAACLGVTGDAADERRRQVADLLTGQPTAAGPVQPPDRPAAVRAGSGVYTVSADEALLAVLEDLTGPGPAVLLLEDLQWADPASIGFLARLGRRIGPIGALVILTVRPGPRPPELDRVLHAAEGLGAVRIALDPLGPAAMTAVAEDLLGAPAGPRLQGKLAACGGSPLFACTLVDALSAEGTIVRQEDGRVDATDDGAPERLGVTVLGWLSSLPAETVDALQIASILGAGFSLTDLALLTGTPAMTLWARLRPAVQAQVIVEVEDRLGFRHELVRDALYQDLPRSVRAALHLELARALAHRNVSPLTVAEHLLRGPGERDPDTLAWLVDAAAEAAPQSPASAVELLSAARALAAPEDPMYAEIVAQLALNLVTAGRRQEGEAICRETLDAGATGEAAARLGLILARSLTERGRPAAAAGEARRVADTAGATPVQRAEALSYALVEPMLEGRFAEAEAMTREALAVAETAGARDIAAVLWVRLAHLAAFHGRFEEEERCAARALAISLEAADRGTHHASHAHLNLALALADGERAREAIELVGQARRLYTELGMEEDINNSHHYACWPPVLAGEWDDALAEMETALSLSEEGGIAWVLDVLALQAVLLTRRDELEPAAAALAQAEQAQAAGAPAFRPGLIAWAQALLAEARGETAPEGPLWEAFLAAGQQGNRGTQRMIAADLTRMLAQAGDADRIGSVAATVGALARDNPSLRSLRALEDYCQGLLTGDVARISRGWSALDPTVRPLERALAAEAAAVGHATAGRRAEARAYAEAAISGLESLGAARDVARVRARLRAAGLAPARRGPRRRELSGWGSLTHSERRVAELAAAGLSNPQIADRLVISRHTVATHISHILTKLELRSRYELAGALAAAADPDKITH